MRILKSHLLKLVNSYLINSSQPSNLGYLWNFGSLLAVGLIIQIVTGVTLAMHYNPSVLEAFNSVEHIMRDVDNGLIILLMLGLFNVLIDVNSLYLSNESLNSYGHVLLASHENNIFSYFKGIFSYPKRRLELRRPRRLYRLIVILIKFIVMCICLWLVYITIPGIKLVCEILAGSIVALIVALISVISEFGDIIELQNEYDMGGCGIPQQGSVITELEQFLARSSDNSSYSGDSSRSSTPSLVESDPLSVDRLAAANHWLEARVGPCPDSPTTVDEAERCLDYANKLDLGVGEGESSSLKSQAARSFAKQPSDRSIQDHYNTRYAETNCNDINEGMTDIEKSQILFEQSRNESDRHRVAHQKYEEVTNKLTSNNFDAPAPLVEPAWGVVDSNGQAPRRPSSPPITPADYTGNVTSSTESSDGENNDYNDDTASQDYDPYTEYADNPQVNSDALESSEVPPADNAEVNDALESSEVPPADNAEVNDALESSEVPPADNAEVVRNKRKRSFDDNYDSETNSSKRRKSPKG